MPISESQLITWTNSPSSTKSEHTYKEVQKALDLSQALKKHKFQVYQQGSYANSTNIKLDSDIDIVVQLNSTFIGDKSNLSLEEMMLYSNTFSKSDYGWNQFRTDVLQALKKYFNLSAVKEENKCIKLPGNQSRVNADIIPCIQHRIYNTFTRDNQKDFIDGMKFWTLNEKKEITNFPKVHLRNGEDKNAKHRTDQMYKHLVRIVKNIRRKLIENGEISPDLARSYFVECTIYNTPDPHFKGSYSQALQYTLNHILKECIPSQMRTVSHQHLLFGDEPWQWQVDKAGDFFSKVHNYYQRN